MRIVQAGLLVVLTFTAVVSAETAPPDKSKAAGEMPLAQNPVWRERVNRLRDQPFAGEIINANVTAKVTGVYEFKDEDKAKVARLQEAYGAELLQKAVKWEEELNALRAEYENKIAALLPEEKREPLRKLLDYSHSRWAADYNYDLNIELGLKKLPETASPEQQQLRAANMAWYKQQREKQKEERQETLKKIHELLTPEESARLEKFDRDRKTQK